MKETPEIKKLDKQVNFYSSINRYTKYYFKKVYYWFIFKFKLTKYKYRNEKSIQEFVDKNRYELILDGHEVKLLLGWIDTEEEDLYYIAWSWRSESYEYISCVGWVHPLKKYIPKFQYYLEKRIWFYNNKSISEMEEILKTKGMVFR